MTQMENFWFCVHLLSTNLPVYAREALAIMKNDR